MTNGITPPPDYAEIAKRLKAGTIVPFFGAGASVGCGLPSGSRLAQRLVAAGDFPDIEGSADLALVASYLVQKKDSLTLRAELRAALTVPCQPGPLHLLLGGLDTLSLYVTTNYDDLIETALAPRSPLVVVDRGTPGNVSCRAPGGEWKEIEAKNLRYEIADKNRPIVLKLHGSLDRDDRTNDTFLITEEHYVDFLGRPEGTQIPSMLLNQMRERSFLFLGYGLKDWNVRVLLRKLAQARGRTDKITSWAIVLEPGQSEQEVWRRQDVEIHGVDLDSFVARLRDALEQLETASRP
jgi:NAD-dependent SIR2 family protein deacetylase